RADSHAAIWVAHAGHRATLEYSNGRRFSRVADARGDSTACDALEQRYPNTLMGDVAGSIGQLGSAVGQATGVSNLASGISDLFSGGSRTPAAGMPGGPELVGPPSPVPTPGFLQGFAQGLIGMQPGKGADVPMGAGGEVGAG